MNKKLIATFFSIVLLLISSTPAMGQIDDIPPKGDEPVDVRLQVESTTPTISDDWILISEETYTILQDGYPINTKITIHQEPEPLDSSNCSAILANQSTEAVVLSLCSSPLSQAVTIQTTLGGITQYWRTHYTRYNWNGKPNLYAWLLSKSEAWWTRTGSQWSVGQTKVTFGPIEAQNCNNENVSKGANTINLTPSWNGNNTNTYTYNTSVNGITYMGNLQPYCHKLGSTPVKLNGSSYGTIPMVKNCFAESGISH